MDKETDEAKIKIKEIKSSLKILGLDEDASQDEIRAAFRELARIYHPDVAAPQDAWRFQQITGAYSVLKNFSLEYLKNLEDNLNNDLENFDAPESSNNIEKNIEKNEIKERENRVKKRFKNIENILSHYEREINNYLDKKNYEAEIALEQELKDNIILRLNSSSKGVKNIALKRVGKLINRDDMRQALINLILRNEMDNDTTKIIEALPMDFNTRVRIASSVCEKSGNFPGSLIIKLLDLRNNFNNFNNNFDETLAERYILYASPENIALILRYWPKNKELSDMALKNLLKNNKAEILIPVLSSMKQNFPQAAARHQKRLEELSSHESPAVRAWCRMLKQVSP